MRQFQVEFEISSHTMKCNRFKAPISLLFIKSRHKMCNSPHFTATAIRRNMNVLLVNTLHISLQILLLCIFCSPFLILNLFCPFSRHSFMMLQFDSHIWLRTKSKFTQNKQTKAILATQIICFHWGQATFDSADNKYWNQICYCCTLIVKQQRLKIVLLL